jgi:hypothetical protein
LGPEYTRVSKMAPDNLDQTSDLTLSTGHLLVIWDVLANKLSGSPFMDELSPEERRAMWSLQDLCEKALGEAGVAPRPEPEWNALMAAARAHVKTIPAEFLD